MPLNNIPLSPFSLTHYLLYTLLPLPLRLIEEEDIRIVEEVEERRKA